MLVECMRQPDRRQAIGESASFSEAPTQGGGGLLRIMSKSMSEQLSEPPASAGGPSRDNATGVLVRSVEVRQIITLPIQNIFDRLLDTSFSPQVPLATLVCPRTVF